MNSLPTTTRRLAACTLLGGTALSLAGAAHADIVSWINPADGVWSDENSWTPHVPLNGDFVLIGASGAAQNTDVEMTFHLTGFNALTLSDGMRLLTDGYRLDLSGAPLRILGMNEVEGEDYRSALVLDDSAFADDLRANSVSLEDNGRMRVLSNSTARMNTLDIEDGAGINGNGYLRLEADNGVALNLNGNLKGQDGTLHIVQEGDAKLDLDGSNETGWLIGNVTVTGTTPTDPFDGYAETLSGGTLTMNFDTGWLVGESGFVTVYAWSAPSVLTGSTIGINGQLRAGGPHGSTIDTDLVLFSDGLIWARGHVDTHLTITGDLRGYGGEIWVGSGALLQIIGEVDVHETQWEMTGGSIVGSPIHNEVGGLFIGHGAIQNEFINDGVVVANEGSMIIVGTGNDWDGEDGGGSLQAVTGDIHLVDNTTADFDGELRTGTGHEIFVDGFRFDMSPSSRLNMVGGTLRSANGQQIGGDVTVWEEATLDTPFTFESTSELAVGADLHVARTGSIQAGASATGNGGRLVIDDNAILLVSDGLSYDVDLQVDGTLVIDLLNDGTATFQRDTASTGTIGFNIGDGDHDRLVVGGTFFAGGTIDVNLTGAEPEEGDWYDLVDFGAFVDDGYTLDLPQIAPELQWDWSDFASDGVLRIEADTCPPDINDDGVVDFTDLVMVLAAWDTDDGWADVDEDGIVGFQDLLAVIAAWGNCPG